MHKSEQDEQRVQVDLSRLKPYGDTMNDGKVQLNWLARGDRPHGEVLSEAVRAWGREFGAEVAGGAGGTGGVSGTETESAEDPDATLWEVPPVSPHGHWYAWLAGEAGTITGLRRHLVKDLGIDKKCVSFMGYWKQGRAEGS